jgi:hypothetical protein
MARYDDLPVLRITVISVIAIAVTVISILAVQVLYFAMYGYIQGGKMASARYVDSDEYLNRQTRSISQYSVHPQDGHYVIPIEQAMRNIAREAATKNENQSAPAGDL